MGKVLVRISTGRKFLLDERIQKHFPDDYKLVKEKKSATAAKKTGGETEGEPNAVGEH